MINAKFPKSKSHQLELISMIAQSIGSAGMAGGQSLDLDSENKKLNAANVENIYKLKTGKHLHPAHPHQESRAGNRIPHQPVRALLLHVSRRQFGALD